MTRVIREAGSDTLVVVGQDDGGVRDRLLNQFYADAGVAFTVSHAWWNDDDLLWNVLAAKRPDRPNLIGETGVQPVWRVNGTWRTDEVTALPLNERKLALSFAAANAGALVWDWAHGNVFGLRRDDGSDKIWLEALEGVARFARQAAPHLGRPIRPDVAIVLPQSLQLSALNGDAVNAQKQCVRALHYGARSAGYVVGEHQLQLLGSPRLILLPSPWVLSEAAWQTLIEKVRGGATLAVSGIVDQDEHFRQVDRLGPLGIEARSVFLDTRENRLLWDGEEVWLSYPGGGTTFLERARLQGDAGLVRQTIGKGTLLYCPWPVELNGHLEAVTRFYQIALSEAEVRPIFTTNVRDPGILIAPSQTETGTVYALCSESGQTVPVAFRDLRSGADFTVTLEPGRAALLLVLPDGTVAARYNVPAPEAAGLIQ
jgi:hypothetical protein